MIQKKIWIPAVLLAAGYLLIGVEGFAWLMPGSELGIFESRIQGPATEFMRRSPELRENFESFRRCAEKSPCDPSAIFAARDALIRKQWPDVYDRLEVRQDWAMCTDTSGCEDIDIKHDDFEAARAKYGYRLRYECVPNIIYLAGSDGHVTYDTNGYTCPT